MAAPLTRTRPYHRGLGRQRPHLGIRRLGLLDGLVILVPRRDFAREVVVDACQPLSQDAKIILNLRCAPKRPRTSWSRTDAAHGTGRGRLCTFLLLVRSDRLVQLFPLSSELLDALPMRVGTDCEAIARV
jgi:hypothetical protein